MSQKVFSWISGIIFTFGAALHLIRSVLGWDLSLNGWSIPVGVSVVAFLFAAFMAYNAFKLGR